MNQRAGEQIDDYSTDLSAVCAFDREISAIPALAHLALYNFDKLPTFMRLVNQTTDLVTLERMASDPNTQLEALLFLAGICSADFCANPALPLLLLENPGLPTAFELASLGRLLSYTGVPRYLLNAIARFGPSEMAHAARLHIGLSGETDDNWRTDLSEALLHLPIIPNDDLLAVLLVFDDVPTWLHERISLSSNPRIFQALAIARGESSDLSDLAQFIAPREQAGPEPPFETLLHMIEDDAPRVRAQAARDPRLPPAVLANLKVAEDWSDSDIDVYRAVASNPSTPAQTLLALADNPSAVFTDVRRAVTLNTQAPPEALALLVDEVFADDIRLILAAHPNLPPDLRERLRNHALATARQLATPFYRAIAAAHHNASIDDLHLAAYSPFWIERLAVALNPHTPTATRALLADDGNRLVRKAAKVMQDQRSACVHF